MKIIIVSLVISVLSFASYMSLTKVSWSNPIYWLLTCLGCAVLLIAVWEGGKRTT